jgi:hypothetical protein
MFEKSLVCLCFFQLNVCAFISQRVCALAFLKNKRTEWKRLRNATDSGKCREDMRKLELSRLKALLVGCLMLTSKH